MGCGCVIAGKRNKVFKRTILVLTLVFSFLNGFCMTAMKTRWCWRKDLSEFRGLTERERTGFLLVLEWAVSARATPGQV
jgi:hypothetical protein